MKRLVALALVSAMFIYQFVPASAAGIPWARPAIISKAAIVVDFETGAVLFSRNADTLRATASFTKMMTVYLVYEAIADGRIGFDTIVPISAYAYDFTLIPNEDNVPLTRSDIYTVDELLDAAIVVSAGAAAVALAELLGGSVSGFCVRMNAKAAQWGINAIFNSASGGSTSTLMTPRAMAVIVRNTLTDFPEVLEKTSKQSIVFHGETYEGSNDLLGVYEGLDGFKTADNSVAGACFAGTARRGDVRIIAVVMGGTFERRFKDTAALLDFGFSNVK